MKEKKQRNKLYEPFLMVAVATIILLLLSFSGNRFRIGKFTSKPVALLSEISFRGTLKMAPYTSVLLDDSIINRHTKTIALRKLDKTSILDFGPDTASALSSFFIALDSISKGKKKIRIAYFGDSMIEGDLLTQDLREYFQRRFGGYGVGFMPVTSVVAGFRKTIIHTFSDNWQDHTLLESVSGVHPLGMTGHVFRPAIPEENDSAFSSSWVRYAASRKRHLDKFCHVKMYYGKPSKSCSIIANNVKIALDGKGIVNEIVLNKDPVKYMSVNFPDKVALNIFGFSFEGDSGVYLDNYSFRGNSGMPLTKMNAGVLAEINKFMEYDLIILQYGINVASTEVTDYSWYNRGMTQVIKHFKKCFPSSGILLVSASDKGLKEEEEYVTDPSIPLLVETQKNIARRNKIAFWNLYEAMGGSGSIVRWAEGDTVLANKDYTHINARGGARIAGMLFNTLMSDFKDSKKKKSS